MNILIKIQSPIDEISKLIEELRGFSDAKNQLLLGNYDQFIWWSFFLLLAIVEILLILSFFWITIKRILLEPNHSDKRNTRKIIIGIIIISFLQIVAGMPFLYPFLSINVSIL